jgi:hypothetical protein
METITKPYNFLKNPFHIIATLAMPPKNLTENTMDPEYKSLWTVMNRLDEEISDIYVASKLLDACAEYIVLEETDHALNTLIGTKEYLIHLQLKLDRSFKELWNKTIKPSHAGNE